MILGDKRRTVIENIKKSAENGEFYNKVELDDPVLTEEESSRITDSYIDNRKRIGFKVKTALARAAVSVATKRINRDTEITGLERIPKDMGGVIITSNHFAPLENTAIRFMLSKIGRKKMNIISQASNFAMRGAIGFLMNYADTIPISSQPRYLARNFMSILKEKLVVNKEAVLLYPEQEMWYNYRKPRPPKRGAYFYGSKLGVPIISCFVEIIDSDEDETPDFKKVKYRVHVLGVLYPDAEKTTKENTEYLAEIDYQMKKECYEKVYGKALVYEFESSDIAGWKGCLDE